MFTEADKSAERKKYGVYIHIPYCKSKCAYCTFESVPDFSTQHAYVERLVGEIRGSAQIGSFVDTVYIGGGTPSCLFAGGVKRILGAVRETFDVDSIAEITVEANPESCTDVFAEECAESGVNRISIGLQSSDDCVLREVGRLHTRNDFIASVRLLRSFGFDNISSDLILGLPHQLVADVDRAIDIMAEHCSHSSVYALSVEYGTPLEKRGYAPDDDYVADLYERALSRLSRYSFERYEVSNFARAGKQSRHNKKYWNCEPYLGFGAAAHGYDGDRIRYYHAGGVDEYLHGDGINYTVLSEVDKYNEYVMLRLRTADGIDKSEFKRRFGYEFEDENGEILDRAVRSGAIVCAGNRIAVAADKMFVMNGIIEEFMKD